MAVFEGCKRGPSATLTTLDAVSITLETEGVDDGTVVTTVGEETTEVTLVDEDVEIGATDEGVVTDRDCGPSVVVDGVELGTEIGAV